MSLRGADDVAIEAGAEFEISSCSGLDLIEMLVDLIVILCDLLCDINAGLDLDVCRRRGQKTRWKDE